MTGNETAEEAQGAERMAAAARHGDELFHFLRRRVGSPDDAEDLRQEALLRIGQAGAGSVHNIRSYLFQVARNLIVDRSRARRKEVQWHAPGAEAAVPCDAPGPDRCAESASDLASLREAVAGLPEKQRLALLWTRLDGVTLKEVGKRLGVSESMAGRYVAQALARCQEVLDGE
ncbi:MAG: sigma-70 family RNA polymerase sigma factor [Candidatus Andeanibacterium colombiense]|uniref:Sigma-70 family RNA polymerase sigma factor n=1 Tax=Candidatus Andeanibacterium colombiense TaxID=3121345 RepID=A0AAJ6BN13_9SPHN|nr:MAG: sigma-70 family RNA polymerase sigma factor [Sphingomonadaceae bacterium]